MPTSFKFSTFFQYRNHFHKHARSNNGDLWKNTRVLLPHWKRSLKWLRSWPRTTNHFHYCINTQLRKGQFVNTVFSCRMNSFPKAAALETNPNTVLQLVNQQKLSPSVQVCQPHACAIGFYTAVMLSDIWCLSDLGLLTESIGTRCWKKEVHEWRI